MYDKDEAYVTPNINQAGSVLPQLNISLWNLVEAGVLAFLIFSVYRVTFMPILPFTFKIAVGIILILPISLIALFGINGVRLSEWIMDLISFRMTRCYVTLRMPMPVTGRLPKDIRPEVSSYRTKDPRVEKEKQQKEKKKKKEEEKEIKKKEKEQKKSSRKKIDGLLKGKGK